MSKEKELQRSHITEEIVEQNNLIASFSVFFLNSSADCITCLLIMK